MTQNPLKIGALLLCVFNALTAASSTTSLNQRLVTEPRDIVLAFRDGGTDSIIKSTRNSRTFKTEAARRASIVTAALREHHQLKARDVASYLRQRRTVSQQQQIKELWISNEIIITKADLSLVQELEAKFGDQIALIREAKIYSFPKPNNNIKPLDMWASEEDTYSIPWGVCNIKADRVWGEYCTGKNVLVGVVDTGVDYLHPNLRGNYYGKCGHHNPYNPSEALPTDAYGHGTHVCGTILGRRTGVAPSAQWISCSGCDHTGECTEAALKECAQYMMCPCSFNSTDPSDDDPASCGRVPDVINCSLGGESRDVSYESVLMAWRAAGIIPIFAAGNGGNNFQCGTTFYPGESPLVYSVGAYDRFNTMGYFSSVGPSPATERLKPDVSALGMDILSSVSGDRWAYLDGTSHATPHVVGAFALLLSCNRDRSPEDIMWHLVHSTQTFYAPGKPCGNLTGCAPRNYYAGNGGLDVASALQSLRNSSNTLY